MFEFWRLNIETKTKRMLHSDRRLSFNEVTNTKTHVLHSSNFALKWHCTIGERSSGGIWKYRTSSFKCYVDHWHIMCSSGNLEVWNWVHLFESRCIIWRPYNTNRVHVKCKSRIDTSNNTGNWNHFRITQTIPEQHIRKAWNSGTTNYSHIAHSTHTAGSADAKVQKHI